MILITGGSGSGKSAYGEKRILEAGEMTRYYIATMEVFGEEGRKKVERHKKLRQGKGFITIESPKDVGREKVLEMLRPDGQKKAVLLECISNLTANEMFGSSFEEGSEPGRRTEALAEIIQLLENDDAIEKMIAYYQKQEVEKQNEIVALSSAVVNHGQIHESHRSRIEKDFFRIRFVGVDKKYYNTDGFEIDLFSYVGTMIKVSALKNVGTTLRDLFIYGDDNEHSLRLGKIGKLVCVPASVFVHDTPGVETRKIGWHNYYNRRNQLYILKEYFPLRYFINRFFKRYILDISILSKNTSEEKKLFKTAQMDALKNKLGKHPVYKPGFVIKEK